MKGKCHERKIVVRRIHAGVCRVCGCTDDLACVDGCSWADKTHTICTRCANAGKRAKRNVRRIITDANHFRGVNAARTRTRNETARKIVKAARTILRMGLTVNCSMFDERERIFESDIRAILEDVL